MATTNNAVTVTAGLLCSALSVPPIGSGASSASLAFTDGDTASDTYVAVSSATALHAALTIGAGEYGLVQLSNPGPLAVTVLIDGSPDVTLGAIPPGTTATPFTVVLPVGNSVVLLGTVASGSQNVGVTVIKADTNA